MLAWLDGLGSSRTHPNENLGREFLELFALGEGNFSEADVRAVARALSGWEGDTYSPDLIRFDEDEHDTAPKTILGQTGNWAAADAVRIACAQPAAAAHVARRLFRRLVADAVPIPPGVLEPLAKAMRVEDDVDVARGIELILHSRLFYSDWCRGKRVKGPVELVIGALCACERFDPPPDFVELEGWLVRAWANGCFILRAWRAGRRGWTGCAGRPYSSAPRLPPRWPAIDRSPPAWPRSIGSIAPMSWPRRSRRFCWERNIRAIAERDGRWVELFVISFRARKHSSRNVMYS